MLVVYIHCCKWVASSIGEFATSWQQAQWTESSATVLLAGGCIVSKQSVCCLLQFEDWNHVSW